MPVFSVYSWGCNKNSDIMKLRHKKRKKKTFFQTKKTEAGIYSKQLFSPKFSFICNKNYFTRRKLMNSSPPCESSLTPLSLVFPIFSRVCGRVGQRYFNLFFNIPKTRNKFLSCSVDVYINLRRLCISPQILLTSVRQWYNQPD